MASELQRDREKGKALADQSSRVSLEGSMWHVVERVTDSSSRPHKTSGETTTAVMRSESPGPEVPDKWAVYGEGCGPFTINCHKHGNKKTNILSEKSYDRQEEGDGWRNSLFSLVPLGKPEN